MREAVEVAAELTADPANVGRARRLLRTALEGVGDTPVDAAELLLSEVVTNAFVHAGGVVKVHVRASPAGVRVEVEDRSSHHPVRRWFAATAGTGRGLQLLDELADRWGSHPRSDGGKVVWFELGTQPLAVEEAQDALTTDGSADEHVLVRLQQAPTLMHLAWQEHAATLLREYLLHVLDEEGDILERHAHASAAMSLLHEQLPVPQMSGDVDALMIDGVEPLVTAEEALLRVPLTMVTHFATLDALLGEAITEAREGRFLSPPTQPEIDEMRRWLCQEVAQQAEGGTPTPWTARTDVRATLADRAALAVTYGHLAAVATPLLATDEASIIVAASPAACDLLGYADADELVGRRVVVVVPTRFHQAHIAGTTLHATNGRSNLLGVPVDVPMVRADGSEVMVHIEVRAERLADERKVFVARFDAVG